LLGHLISDVTETGTEMLHKDETVAPEETAETALDNTRAGVHA
jgi:hypothetical protein